ncbi:MAG: hypothetical protein ACJ07L_15125 [Opitutales bacterium]
MIPDYACIREVASFEELVSTPFANGVNAHCWVRSLAGDFNEIVDRLNIHVEITTLEGEALQNLELCDSGKIARDALIEDQRLLSEFGLSPMLDCIPAYPRDPDPGTVPTDVYSYHVDSATAEADTYLCSYNEASSEGLRNEDALRRIDIPETRAALLDQYGGKDDTGFLAYLKDDFLDLHYMPILKAKPYTFGLGNLWRIATQYPGSPVPPCIHRAPTTSPGRPSRLLLIS